MKTTYSVAASIDGYIADRDGGVGFLDQLEGEPDHSAFAEFLESVDALVMGRRTFDQVLSFGAWPYGSRHCTVVTHRELLSEIPGVVASKDHAAEIHGKISADGHQHLWVVGGAEIASEFLKARCIDEIVINTVPFLLGNGVPLFSDVSVLKQLQFVRSAERPNGIVETVYGIADLN